MNMLDLHHSYMQNMTVFISNYEYQIRVLQALLQVIHVDTDNPMLVLLISRLTININNFIVDLQCYIDDMKQAISGTYLSDIEHLPYDELKKLLLKEREILNGLKDTQELVNNETINLIRNKYIIDNIMNDEELGL